MLNIVKGYKDYGTFIIHQFEAEPNYTPVMGDVVTINSNGKIEKATSGTKPIATGIVFEAGTISTNTVGKYVVLLGQGVIETDNITGNIAVGNYVEINGGKWQKCEDTSTIVPSGIVLWTAGSGSNTRYFIYKFI